MHFDAKRIGVVFLSDGVIVAGRQSLPAAEWFFKDVPGIGLLAAPRAGGSAHLVALEGIGSIQMIADAFEEPPPAPGPIATPAPAARAAVQLTDAALAAEARRQERESEARARATARGAAPGPEPTVVVVNERGQGMRVTLSEAAKYAPKPAADPVPAVAPPDAAGLADPATAPDPAPAAAPVVHLEGGIVYDRKTGQYSRANPSAPSPAETGPVAGAPTVKLGGRRRGPTPGGTK